MTREQDHEQLERLKGSYNQLFNWVVEEKEEWDDTFQEELNGFRELHSDVREERNRLTEQVNRDLEYMHEVYERGGIPGEPKKNSKSWIPALLAGLGIGGGGVFYFEHRRRKFVLKALERRIETLSDMSPDNQEKLRHAILKEFLENNFYSEKEKERWRNILFHLMKNRRPPQ